MYICVLHSSVCMHVIKCNIFSECVSLYNMYVYAVFVAMRWYLPCARTANHETRIVLELSESNVIKSYGVGSLHWKMYEQQRRKCAFRIAKCENVKWYELKYASWCGRWGTEVDEKQSLSVHVCVCVCGRYGYLYLFIQLSITFYENRKEDGRGKETECA